MAWFGLSRRAGKISFGTESVEQTILKNKAKLVIVAEDASERTKKHFEEICKNKRIQIRNFGNI